MVSHTCIRHNGWDNVRLVFTCKVEARAAVKKEEDTVGIKSVRSYGNTKQYRNQPVILPCTRIS